MAESVHTDKKSLVILDVSSHSSSFQSEKYTEMPFRIVFKKGLYLGSSITHLWARSCSRGSHSGVLSDSLSEHL